MSRSDVHSPKNLRTEDYEFAFCGVHKAPEGEFDDAKWRMEQVNRLLAEGYRFDDVHDSGTCSHCGTHINYYAVLLHVPSKTMIHVGENCLDNRFGRATSEFQKLRAQSALDRQQQRIKKARGAFRADHVEFCEALEDENFLGAAGGTDSPG